MIQGVAITSTANKIIVGGEVKSMRISWASQEHFIHLVAVQHHNAISNSSGFVLYLTKDIASWTTRSSSPFIDALLFKTAEEAFRMGERVILLKYNEIIPGQPRN